MPDSTPEWTSAATLFALLCAGHALASVFVPVDGGSVSRARGAWHFAIRALGPLLLSATAFSAAIWGAFLLAGASLAHIALDRGRRRLDLRSSTHSFERAVAVQLAHLIVLYVVWNLWPAIDGDSSTRVGRAAAIVAVYAFNIGVGSDLVAELLRRFQPNGGEADGEPGAGRVIGIMERLIITTLVWKGEWGAVGLVLTAKSVARFKKLEDKDFAEAYLIGTMGSLIVAMASGTLLAELL